MAGCPGICPAALAKLGKNEPVNMAALLNICASSFIGIADMAEIVPSESGAKV